ncbi:MAG: GNAT family N-acetyltransferase [Gemmatirosa sp.]
MPAAEVEAPFLVLARAPGDPPVASPRAIPTGYTIELWRPAGAPAAPPGPAGRRFLVWWLAHHGRVFANRDYGAVLVRRGDEIVHRSMVFPRYWTFPFMAPGDLQIGDTWTADAHRGRGLATAVLAHALDELARPGRTFWYVVHADNMPSIRAAESAGMRQVASAARLSRFGLRPLGHYALVAPPRA